MSPIPEPSPEMLALLAAACEGMADCDEMTRLESLIGHDETSIRLLLDHFRLHAELTLRFRGEAALSNSLHDLETTIGTANGGDSVGSVGSHRGGDEPLAASPIVALSGNTIHGAWGYLSSGWPVAYLVATVIFGVGLLVGAITHVSQPVPVAVQLPPVTTGQALPERGREFVGRITGMVDCRWVRSPESGAQSPALDPRLSTLVSLGDTFALSSGLLEITYDTGAKVIVQGPATYEVQSPASGFLSIGKLTARVEKSEERRTKNEELSDSRSSFPISHSYFAIRTPTATVTDLGTEFGVEVSKAGDTTSHVFRGAVDVQPVSRDGRRGQPTRLNENESVHVENGAGGDSPTVRRVTVAPDAFVRVEQLPTLATELRLKAFRRWQAYSEELRRDPSLLAYYDFQQKPGLPSVLPNVAANGDESLDGVVENATWTNGRMSGKHALLFNGPDDYVRVNLPQKTDDLTLAVWIYVDSLRNHYNGILMSERWQINGLLDWKIRSENRVGFTVFGAPPIDLQLGPLGSDRPIERRWLHLAVVYDHAAARVWFYEDGYRKDDAAVEKHVPVCIGSARISRWAGEPPYNLYGRIDELAVFGRALMPDEIQRMYEAGKPSGN